MVNLVLFNSLPATGACTFYNELDVDDGYSFDDAMAFKTQRLQELEEAGVDPRQLNRVRVFLVGSVLEALSCEALKHRT